MERKCIFNKDKVSFCYEDDWQFYLQIVEHEGYKKVQFIGNEGVFLNFCPVCGESLKPFKAEDVTKEKVMEALEGYISDFVDDNSDSMLSEGISFKKIVKYVKENLA